MKKSTLVFAILFAVKNVFGQIIPPSIIWQRALGGTKCEESRFIQLTPDGGCIFTGFSRSVNGDVTVNKGEDDLWVVKLDANGTMQWQKTFGGSDQDWGRHIQLTGDGGYIIAGHNFSTNDSGDVKGNKGGFDYWILKLSNSGELQWQKSLGGLSLDLAYRVHQTSEGNFIAFGGIKSDDGDVTGKITSDADYWIVMLDDIGNLLWQKVIGGSKHEEGSSLELTSDGGFIISGFSNSNSGDVSGNHGDYDAHIVKMDGEGNIQWSKCYGGTHEDAARDARQTSDGGYIFAGYTNSNDGDISGNHGGQDALVVKLDSNGDIQWQKSLGGTSLEYAYYVEQSLDNSGYLVAGHSGSDNGDATGNHGMYDCWVLKLDLGGNLIWQRSFGGSEQDYGRAITQTYSGDYLVAGSTNSIDGDVTDKHSGPGSSDSWILKLAGNCELQTFFFDCDGDSYGNPAVTSQACTAPPGYVPDQTDCNDSNSNIHPNANEMHNWLDDDCDSQVDDSLRLTFSNDLDYGDFDLQFIKAHSIPSGFETHANDSRDRNTGLLTEKMKIDLSGPQSIAVFPNPVFRSTTISFSLKETSSVLIELLDVNGRNVIIIGKGGFPAGNHEITFDRGSLVAGIYFLQLKTGEGGVMKKLVVE